MQAKLHRHKQLRSIMSEGRELSKIQQAVILVHVLNLQFGLQCISRNGEKLEFPQDWAISEEGVFKFQYRYQNLTILFRLVNCDNQRISVNFVPQDSEQLNQVEIQYSQSDLETIIKIYDKSLQKLKGNKTKNEGIKQESGIRRLQPVWKSPQPHQPTNPLIIQPSRNHPFQQPFNGSQYVGPDHHIFQDRFKNPVFQGPQGLRRPPGARFDPTNPFGIDQDYPKSHDFTGFNQFGMPKGGNNRFNPFG